MPARVRGWDGGMEKRKKIKYFNLISGNLLADGGDGALAQSSLHTNPENKFLSDRLVIYLANMANTKTGYEWMAMLLLVINIVYIYVYIELEASRALSISSMPYKANNANVLGVCVHLWFRRSSITNKAFLSIQRLQSVFVWVKSAVLFLFAPLQNGYHRYAEAWPACFVSHRSFHRRLVSRMSMCECSSKSTMICLRGLLVFHIILLPRSTLHTLCFNYPAAHVP